MLLVYSAFFKVCIARWAYLFRWLVDFRPGGVPVSVVGRPVCKPPKRGGTGARVQGRSRRPQAGPGLCKASAGAAWAVVARRRVRCTSGRSASVACGVRGVRAINSAAQQRGSRQSDSSKQAKRLEHHDVVEEVAQKRMKLVAKPPAP